MIKFAGDNSGHFGAGQNLPRSKLAQKKKKNQLGCIQC